MIIKNNKVLQALFTLFVVFGLYVHPAKANSGEIFYGVNISRSSNYLSPNNSAFPFNVKRFGLDSMWNISDPTKITIPTTGIWLVGADMTSLGLNYASVGGVDSSRQILEIVKNWCGAEVTCPHLESDIIFERFETQNAYGANGNSTSSIVYLEEGDYLQLLTSGKYGMLLIESNPYGLGTLSPHFYAHYLGSLP